MPTPEQSEPEPEPERPAVPSVPGSAEEALALARTRFAPVWPDGTPAPLTVQEFDDGYLVRARLPPREAGRRTGPGNPGGVCVVVEKETGRICTLPHRPARAAIELYRAKYRPTDR